MVEKNVNILAEKYRLGRCTPEELALIESWYLTLKDTNDLPSHARIEETMAEVWAKLNISAKPALKLWPRITTIAAAVTAIAMCIYLFNQYRHDLSPGETAEDLYSNDIAPGSNGATITLANGKTIELSGAKKGVVVGKDLTYNDGTGIDSSKLGMTNGGSLSSRANAKDLLTATTARGKTYQFTLPDGSKVWLNADSKITFPSQFSGKERIVQLSGEAYWQVAKDSKHPFVVKTDKQDLQVLGTHFNISAYPGQPIITALEEGSVKITAGGHAKTIVPGEQTVLVNNAISVEEADLYETLAWKDGNFAFNTEKIEDIMTALSRWYDIEVEYRDGVKGRTFSGNISRFKNISQVLKMLEKTKDVHFKIEGRRVTVTE
ncbi:MAG: FecR domain-containing protein [Bacteroidota bacterium]